MEHFSILSQINEQLAQCTDLKAFLKIVVGVVKEITGFHRVLIYQVREVCFSCLMCLV
jgi:light-regulated signal transduction histidine kinase (bacteriophytochrome)